MVSTLNDINKFHSTYQLKMDITERLNILAEARESDEILVYITSDKPPTELFSTQIAPDAIAIFDKHLYKVGKKRKISLFLYSNGGSLDAPWPLVSLIREYCKYFEVIIPFKALSAATLLCLGADRIVMTPLSSMSPIDPQGAFQLGQERKQIQVEDVTGFIDFAKGKVGIGEQGPLAEVMKLLSSEIPPSMLGSINRTHSLIRLLADALLTLHRKKLEEAQKRQIVESLTEKLFSHQHLIGRREARFNIGFKDIIDYADDGQEKLIRECFDYYKKEIQLEKIFDPEEIVRDETNGVLILKRAIIQSSVGEDAFVTRYVIQRIQDPNAPKPFAIKMENQRWEEINAKKRGGEKTNAKSKKR